MRIKIIVAFLIGILIPQLILVTIPTVFAETEIEKLRKEIDSRSNRLTEIEAEIAKFESQLKEVGSEKKTLQSAISKLELEHKKVNAEISKTENQISFTDLEINKLILEIEKTEAEARKTQNAIGEIIRAEYMASDQTLIELMLGQDRFLKLRPIMP